MISLFLTVKEAERRNWISPGNRGGGRNERKKTKTRITAPYCPQLILPPLHTKTFDSFQWHSPALPVTPPHSGLDKLTQYGSAHSQARSLSSLWPLCLSHSLKSALNWRRGGLLCVAPPDSPSPPFSSILSGSARRWGPMRPLCRSMACGYPWSRVTQSAALLTTQDFRYLFESKSCSSKCNLNAVKWKNTEMTSVSVHDEVIRKKFCWTVFMVKPRRLVIIRRESSLY